MAAATHKPSPVNPNSGHRARLRERFLKAGPDALADYEMLEMILFAANPRGDVKPLAKRLIKAFGSFASVIKAEPEELLKVEQVTESVVSSLKVIHASAQQLLKEEIKDRPVIQSWSSLLDYCRLAMGHRKEEEFRLLFLNQKHALIADEVQNIGTVNHTPVYPREVVKRALELGASSIILVHNHPSGDVKPSKEDIDMTRQIITAAHPLEIKVHDHIIVGAKNTYSFRSNGLI
jgi:DNA repair protein RadC